VRRYLTIVVHNWPLKLAAVGLAILLYVVLFLGQNSKDFRAPIPIDVRNQPANAVLLSGVQYVTSIRYAAPADVASRVTADLFSTWVDLAGVTPDATNPTTVSVNAQSSDPDITILDWSPRRITVTLDPLATKTVPVQVDTGTLPPNLQVRPPILDATEVTVKGTQSSVSQVVGAVAQVRIDPSGVSLDAQVDLTPVDIRGETVNDVSLTPSSVRVKIIVGSQLQNRSIPINPVVTGTPANGFELTSIEVTPLVVTIEGDVETITALTKIDTQPVSVSGASSDVSQTVGLVLPDGVVVLGDPTTRVTAHISSQTGTRTFSVGPVLSGAHDDRTYTLSTDQVNLTIGGSSAVLAGIQGDSLVVTADVNALGPGTHVAPLKTTLPAGVTLVAISPPTVTVTVALVASPQPSPPSAAPSAAP
jgi:YbbR domain-containing protein